MATSWHAMWPSSLWYFGCHNAGSIRNRLVYGRVYIIILCNVCTERLHIDDTWKNQFVVPIKTHSNQQLGQWVWTFAHETPFYKIYRLPVCILALILKTDWINFRHSKDTSRRTILICKIASLSVWLIHEKMKSWVDHDEDVSTISECFSNKMIIDSDINTNEANDSSPKFRSLKCWIDLCVV